MGYTANRRTQDPMKITNATVRNLAPPETGYQLEWDSELRGFGVRVTAAGAKSYVAQAKVNGKTRRVTLGRHGVITADQARRDAKTELGRMAGGTDPSDEKRREKALSVSLEEVAESYLANRRTREGLPLKERTKADIRYHLKSTFQAWRNQPIANITREKVQRRYAEHCRRSVAQANQSMRVLRALIEYAMSTYRTPEGEKIISDNPVDVLRESSMLRSVKPKSRQVPLERLGEWWSAVQAMRSDPALTTASRSAADLVAFLALTGLRIGEARAIQWDQVNLEEPSLVLTDTKNRTNVTLPLSDLAAEIIRLRPRGSDYVFPARTGSGHLKDCRGQLQLIGEQTGIEVTAHDLRRTFRAVAAACNVELWRTKALMNHKQNSDVTLANYTDLSDVRYLQPDANLIGDYFEAQRHESKVGLFERQEEG